MVSLALFWDLPNPEIEPGSPAMQANCLPGEPRFLFFFFFQILEGNGTPLPYSCLENPMDGGTWWAAVYGVA